MKALEPEVLDILSQSSITENLLVLPEGQLERKLYEKVAKAIKLAGGKWNRSKAGFIFDKDPREKLGLALETGKIVDEKKERQAFYTPEVIADEIALLADLAGCSVLEPSAGDGNLAKSCVKFGAKAVDCIELEENCYENLIQLNSGKVFCKDFLEIEPNLRYERVVMNPPFSKRQYVKHISHAIKFLKPDGKLFAVVPNNDCEKIKDLGCRIVKSFSNGAFKESGTMVSTALVCYENFYSQNDGGGSIPPFKEGESELMAKETVKLAAKL